MRKISYILTLPSFNNFGGVLQAYALQQMLKKLGIRNRQICYLPKGMAEWFDSLGKRFKLRCWKTLFKMVAGSRSHQLHPYMEARLFRFFRELFMGNYRLDTQRTQLGGLAEGYQFIVGSDQVWRCEYSRPSESVPFFFLSFATQEQRQRSIAYAASFGADEWEGTPAETAECASLLKDFKAVSVREHSGIRLCREIFGVDAVQMPDPTLLLEPEDYSRLIRRWWTLRQPQPSMAVYLLDESGEKKQLTQAVAEQAALCPQQLTAHKDAPKAMDRIPLSIPQWLRCIRDAECVLTDSFHGCVFAIIFNKPFVCLGNEARGASRFDSLFSTFGLQDRLLINPTAEQVAERMSAPIDWDKVNSIRRSEKQRALQFLKEKLE